MSNQTNVPRTFLLIRVGSLKEPCLTSGRPITYHSNGIVSHSTEQQWAKLPWWHHHHQKRHQVFWVLPPSISISNFQNWSWCATKCRLHTVQQPAGYFGRWIKRWLHSRVNGKKKTGNGGRNLEVFGSIHLRSWYDFVLVSSKGRGRRAGRLTVSALLKDDEIFAIRLCQEKLDYTGSPHVINKNVIFSPCMMHVICDNAILYKSATGQTGVSV